MNEKEIEAAIEAIENEQPIDREVFLALVRAGELGFHVFPDHVFTTLSTSATCGDCELTVHFLDRGDVLDGRRLQIARCLRALDVLAAAAVDEERLEALQEALEGAVAITGAQAELFNLTKEGAKR